MDRRCSGNNGCRYIINLISKIIKIAFGRFFIAKIKDLLYNY
jgi:hypothetical protein